MLLPDTRLIRGSKDFARSDAVLELPVSQHRCDCDHLSNVL
jgi:hypothetical protein